MTISARDQKLLGVWVVLVALGYWFYLRPDSGGPSVIPAAATADSVSMAETRLAKLRDIAATAPAKQEILKKVSEEVAGREQSLIRAETVPQAEAQMIAALRELMGLESPSIEIRSQEMLTVEPFGGDGSGPSYGLAPVRVTFECRMAQLVNVLAGLAARPQLMGTRDFQITASNPKEKTVRVSLTIVGVVPKELVPDKSKKGAAGL
ncbi:MAG: type II secretion system protein GspM [Bryobacteraceae bacterium]